jgi:surface protein
MNKKKKILLVLIGIFLVISILIGVSYAYYIFSVSQSGSNVVRTDCFEITYTDGNAINLSNTIPLSDKEARELDPYTFTIKNICNSTMLYSVNIETLEGTTMDLDAVAVKLDGNMNEVLSYFEDNDVLVNGNAVSSKIIGNSYLNPGEEVTHKLWMYIDEYSTIEQSMNKVFSSKVVINASMGKPTKIIAGMDFNATIKRLAGIVPSERDYSNLESDREYYSEYCNSIDVNSIDYFECEDNLYRNSFDSSVYFMKRNTNIYNILFSDTMPASNVDYEIVSTDDSKSKIYAWFTDNTIYLYCDDNIIYSTDMSYMFSDLNSLRNVDLHYFNTSKTTNMSHMFYNSFLDDGIDLESLNTSNVTDMSSMFTYYSGPGLSVGHFDTSNVRRFDLMFSDARNVKQLDVGGFDTSKATNMADMFYDMYELESLDVSNFDTSNVLNMSGMFTAIHHVPFLDLSHFDTSKVIDMSSMFYGAQSISTLDLSNFNTSNVTDMKAMFTGMRSLNSIDLSSFDTSNVTNMSGMFSETNIALLDLSNFSTHNVVATQYMFNSCSNLNKIYVGDDWDMSNIDESSNMYYTGSKGMMNAINIVGGAGTTYNSSHTDKEYARVDCWTERPGYLTYKGPIGSNAAYCASIGYDYNPNVQ